MPSKTSKTLGVRFPNADVAKIEAIAKERGTTYTTVVREIVAEYLQKAS